MWHMCIEHYPDFALEHFEQIVHDAGDAAPLAELLVTIFEWMYIHNREFKLGSKPLEAALSRLEASIQASDTTSRKRRKFLVVFSSRPRVLQYYNFSCTSAQSFQHGSIEEQSWLYDALARCWQNLACCVYQLAADVSDTSPPPDAIERLRAVLPSFQQDLQHLMGLMQLEVPLVI
jgi:hypothetical protein